MNIKKGGREGGAFQRSPHELEFLVIMSAKAINYERQLLYLKLEVT